MTQVNKGKGYEGVWAQIKSNFKGTLIFQFKNTRRTSKRVAITEKKGKTTCQKNHIYQPGAFTYKSYPSY